MRILLWNNHYFINMHLNLVSLEGTMEETGLANTVKRGRVRIGIEYS